MRSLSRPAKAARGILAAAVAAMLAPDPSQAAAPAKVRLRLAAKPVRAALLDLALQANLSLGGDVERCGGRSPRLFGVMPLDEALDRILAGSACAWTRIDTDTVVIRLIAKAPPKPTLREPEATAPLGEVIVTAQRQPNLPGRTPFSLSVVSGEQARRDKVADLGDLEGEVAGMSTTHLGPGRDKILLRGLSDGAYAGQTQSIVALYLDEVPITYNAPDPDLRLADIERVEVLRGPQGTLYGGGSIGGVVRVVTRRPDLDETSLDLLGETSVTRGAGLGSALEATANLPLRAGKAAARVLAYRERSDGYIANPAMGLAHANDSDRHGGRLSLRALLTPDWSADLVATHQSIHNDDTQYGLRRLGSLLRDNIVREPHDNSFDQGSLTVSGEGPWGRLTASASRLGHHFTSRFDASGAAALYGLPPVAAAFDEARRTDLTIAEVTYATPAGAHVQGLAGAFVSAGKTRMAAALGGIDARGARTDAAYAETRADDIREAAIYGELTYALTKRLSLTAGLRWFDYGLDTDSRLAEGAGSRAFSGRIDENGLSPKLLLSYAPSPDLLLYAQAAEGYRAGGFNTAGRLGAAASRYHPDELWNYEIGAKARWMEERLQMRAALFAADWTSIQSDQYRPDGLAYTANVGAGHNLGLELETAWRVTPSLDLRAAALVSQPSLKRRDPALDPAGVALAGINGATASLAFDYHRALGAQTTIRLQGRARYVGHAVLNLEPQATPAPDFVEASTSLSWETPRWTLTAYADNLFDRTSDSFAFGNPFNRGDTEVTPLRPRTVGMRLSTRF